MKIGIVGGGPAGLYFALLMKKRNPRHEIRVFEQNSAENTYGWGVVFSGRALAFLADSDPASYQDIENQLEIWHELVLGHQGQLISIDGSDFSGISRIALLFILQKHCHQAGVALHFNTPLRDLAPLRDCDLIVGADGVHSLVRQQWSCFFQPTLDMRSNKYIWYGTHRVFRALSLIFRQNTDGVFVAHTYPYSPTSSTFIVECDATTWKQAGFATMTEAESRTYCEAVFQDDLAGQALLSNKSTWLNFIVVRNQYWYHKNIVLLGDALRTVHFSIGSGTRTALEDAIALSEAFQVVGEEVENALQCFTKKRKPTSEQLQKVAENSLLWYENFRDLMPLTSLDFAYHYMTRGGRVDQEKLRKKAPQFVAAYEAVQR